MKKKNFARIIMWLMTLALVFSLFNITSLTASAATISGSYSYSYYPGSDSSMGTIVIKENYTPFNTIPNSGSNYSNSTTDTLMLLAKANAGYTFKGFWISINGSSLTFYEGYVLQEGHAMVLGDYDKHYNISLKNNDVSTFTAYAQFEAVTSSTTTYTITPVAVSNGSVSGGGTVVAGGSTTITATPNSGYKFAYWMYVDSGAQYIYTNPATITNVQADRTYYAVFEENGSDASPADSFSTVNFSTQSLIDSVSGMVDGTAYNGGTAFQISSGAYFTSDFADAVKTVSNGGSISMSTAGSANVTVTSAKSFAITNGSSANYTGTVTLANIGASVTLPETATALSGVNGYVAVNNNNVWTLQNLESTYVAQVNDGTKYATIQEAINAAQDGDTVYLLKSVSVSSELLLTTNKAITLNGNGHTIKRASGNNDNLIATTNGKLTLLNITVDGGAIWEGDNPVTRVNTGLTAVCTNRFDGTLLGVVGGQLVLGNGATLQNNHRTGSWDGVSDGGSAVVVNNTAVFTMEEGSQILNCTVHNTGSADASSGGDGAAISIWNSGAAYIKGGLISGNFAPRMGGVVRVCETNAALHISGGTITNNWAKAQHFGNFAIAGHKSTISGSPVIEDNWAVPHYAADGFHLDEKVQSQFVIYNGGTINATGLNVSKPLMISFASYNVMNEETGEYVTARQAGTIMTGGAAYADMFTSAIDGYRVAVENGNLVTKAVTGTVYYVDAVNGSDSNSGNRNHPFQTLDKALASYTGDCTIVLLNSEAVDGVFINTVTKNNVFNGNRAYTVTIISEGNTKTIDDRYQSTNNTYWHLYAYGANLILDNVIVDGTNGTKDNYGAFFIGNFCSLTLQNGAVLQNYKNRAVNVRPGGTLNILEGCSILNNKADTNVYFNGDNMDGVENAGGAVYVCAGGRLNLQGGSGEYAGKDIIIKGNTGDKGAGIYLESGSYMNTSMAHAHISDQIYVNKYEANANITDGYFISTLLYHTYQQFDDVRLADGASICDNGNQGRTVKISMDNPTPGATVVVNGQSSIATSLYSATNGDFTMALSGNNLVVDIVNPVAVIGTTGYATIQDAVNAIANGTNSGEIKLLRDVTDEAVTIPSYNGEIVLDLNGHTVYRTKDTILFNVSSGVTFVLKNGYVDGSNVYGVSSPINIWGTFKAFDVTYQNCSVRYGVVLSYNNTVVELTRCTFTGNTASANGCGSALHIYASLKLTDCTITGNTDLANDRTQCVAVHLKTGATIELVGKNIIYDNHHADGTQANIGLVADNQITVSGDITGSKIGIYAGSFTLVAHGTDSYTVTATDAKCFYDDSGVNAAVKSDNTVVWQAAVAQIGDVRYETIQAAVNAIASGENSGEIKILTDVSDEFVALPVNCGEVVIDLNGHTISRTTDIHLFRTNGGSTLILKNGVLDGKNTGGTNSVIDSYGTFKAYDVTFQNFTTRYGVIIAYEFNTSNNRQGIVELTRCTIKNNTANSNGAGAALHIYNSIKLTDCTITGNKDLGGDAVQCVAVHLKASAKLELVGENYIYDNFRGDAQANITLTAENQITVSGDISGSKIGIYANGKTPIAQGTDSYTVTSADALCFIDDTNTYAAAKSDNTVVFVTAAAEVNGVKYASIQDAINAIPDGTQTTVKLLGDITEAINISAGKDIILDLNGHDITSTGRTLTNNGKLTIINSSDEPASVIGGNWCVTNYGELNINGDNVSDITIFATGDNDAIANNQGGTIHINGATIKSNGWYAICDRGGTTGNTITNAHLECGADGDGGAFAIGGYNGQGSEWTISEGVTMKNGDTTKPADQLINTDELGNDTPITIVNANEIKFTDDDGDRTYVVEKLTAAEKLQQAINNAKPGDVIKLEGDISGSITIPADKNVILDLNGYSITSANGDAVQNYGTLTIKDSSADKTGLIQATNNNDAIHNQGHLTIESGTIEGSKDGINQLQGGTTVVNGGTIKGGNCAILDGGNSGDNQINGGTLIAGGANGGYVIRGWKANGSTDEAPTWTIATNGSVTMKNETDPENLIYTDENGTASDKFNQVNVADFNKLEFVENGDGSYTVQAKPTVESDILRFINLSLNGGIGVNLYFMLPDTYFDGTYKLAYQVADGTVYYITVDKDALVYDPTEQTWEFSISVDAKQMTDEIKFWFVNEAGDTFRVRTTTVKYYADYILSANVEELNCGANESTYLKALMAAMLNYGAEAQTYFNYNLDNLANAGLSSEYDSYFADIDGTKFNKNNSWMVATGDFFAGSSIDGEGIEGIQVGLGGTTSIDIYFRVAKGTDLEKYKFVISHTELYDNGNYYNLKEYAYASADKSDDTYDYYYVSVQGIPAAYLDHTFRMEIYENGSKIATLETMVTWYIYTTVTNGAADDALVAIVTDLYWYNYYANLYFKY